MARNRGNPSPDSDASPSLPGPVVRNCDVLFFRSKTVALNKLVGQPKLPGLIEDYRSTFAKAKAMKVDVLLGLHPEVYDVRAGEARDFGFGPDGASRR